MSYFFTKPLILSRFAKYLRWIWRQIILSLKVYEQNLILINTERTDGAESYTGFRWAFQTFILAGVVANPRHLLHRLDP